MKKIFGLFAIALIVVALTVTLADDGRKYGKDITLTEKTKIADILANPKDYSGKTVLIEGTVVNVCSDQGCWIDVQGANENEVIRVKVEDGVIVFPTTEKGNTALVQGKIFEVKVEPTTVEVKVDVKDEHANCTEKNTTECTAEKEKQTECTAEKEKTTECTEKEKTAECTKTENTTEHADCCAEKKSTECTPEKEKSEAHANCCEEKKSKECPEGKETTSEHTNCTAEKTVETTVTLHEDCLPKTTASVIYMIAGEGAVIK